MKEMFGIFYYMPLSFSPQVLVEVQFVVIAQVDNHLST